MPPPPPPATRTMSPPTRRPGDRDQIYNPRQSDASLPYRSDNNETVTIQKPNGSETTFKLPPTNLKDLPYRPAPNGTSDPKRRPSDPAYRPGDRDRDREPQPQRRASSPSPGTIPPAPVSPTSKPSYVPGHSPPGSRNPSYGNYNPPASSNGPDKKGSMPGGFPTGGAIKIPLDEPLDPRSPSFARRPPPAPAPINGGMNGDHGGSLNAIGGGTSRRPDVVESIPGPAASLPSNKDDRDRYDRDGRTRPGANNPRYGSERPPSPGYTKPIRPPPPRNSSTGNSDYGVPTNSKPNGNTIVSNPNPGATNPSNPSRPSIGPGRHGSIIEMMPGPAALSPPPPPPPPLGHSNSHSHGPSHHPSLGLALGPKPSSSLSKPTKTAAKLTELEEGLLYGDTERYPPQMELGDYRQATECSLREYMALQRKRRQISYKIAAGNSGKEAALVEEKLRFQASTAIDELIELRGRVAEIVRRAEKARWRRYLWSGAFAIFIPLVKSFFRPSTVDKGAHAREHKHKRGHNRTEYAFRKSKSLIDRILTQARRPGLASLSFLVFAVLYVFTNEVSLRAAKTVSRRLKRLTAKVERGRELGEEDFKGLQGWRWGVLELTA
ncbi:hypothetical protein SMACR_03071 [Sordaria macrospora]|uniref:Uncharacterized protein n=1 Tax=Sordaria macrospora TaxID=5147 RepID=A0A8S8ZSQ3_SORMA|nr:hypothetical protein SMACR_03071 [Sordaria macrospora]KAH7630983.1 hypothetical protein B0T09DRAFT_408656 [Sordaria sp. MPI-SDFR-AT-0083]WPJ61908.1 hypothetical protein SMAC4_03071 [Sordaria macrospora]